MVLGSAEVERARFSVQRNAERPVQLFRDLVSAGEVPPGAARDQRQLDALAPGDAVDDLVESPVAADDDEQRRAFVGCFSCELAQLAGTLREDRFAAQAGVVGGPRDLRPLLPRLPVRRRRIDEENRLVRQRYFSAVIVRSASSVI